MIFYLSGVPSLKTSLSYDFILRKCAHAGEYLILTLLLKRAFEDTFRPGLIFSVICPASTAFLYAVSDEVHQMSVQGRSGNIRDVLFDSLGIAAFFLLAALFRRKSSA